VGDVGYTDVEQDVNVLKLRSSRGEPTKLDLLLQVEGERVLLNLETMFDDFLSEGQRIGSALIDIRVQQLLVERLRHIAHRLPASPLEISERMMDRRFERFKCSFGTNAFNKRRLLLAIPGLSPGTGYPFAGISDYHKVRKPRTLSLPADFTREELKEILTIR
jgi:hypothetical protein